MISTATEFKETISDFDVLTCLDRLVHDEITRKKAQDESARNETPKLKTIYDPKAFMTAAERTIKRLPQLQREGAPCYRWDRFRFKRMNRGYVMLDSGEARLIQV